MIKQDNHVFQGIKQDSSPITQESKFLWDAFNIRFTIRDYNTSTLTMTNERGTTFVSEMKGVYVGYCTVGSYLVVFTSFTENNEHTNYIYRIGNNALGRVDNIYIGNLNIRPENELQTLGIYEGDLVQKVYWVDGVNQPRVINIMADKLLYNKDYPDLSVIEKSKLYPKGCFDFVQELSLDEEISVKREEGGGTFSPGIIQYAFSYYNKYGQESNIFYTTELFNISYVTRGGSPEDVVSNSFHISVKNLETNFQYLRIYSIHRTSLNATPNVKIVTDIELSSAGASESAEILYIDTGTTGDNIDPSKMLYIGGESIIASTITEKDNTLFLGNIELKKDYIPSAVKESLRELFKNDNVEHTTRTITFKNIDDDSSLYDYNNQLIAGNTSTFKVGDTYRLGLQFQYKNGKWSEPCWLGDYTVPRYNKPHRGKDKSGNDTLTVPSMFISNLGKSNIDTLSELGYKKVRPLVVLPTTYDRTVLAQGILCPTVFNAKERYSNTPFAQSSWFFRPISAQATNSTGIENGATVAFKHLEPLFSEDNRGAEIQNMPYLPFDYVNREVKNNNTSINAFYVDQSILTMHSPDIEFDDSTKQALEGNDFELDIVGVASFKNNAGDISIQTSSAVPAPGDEGFFHKSFFTTNYENKGMVAGMFYKSHLVDENENAAEYSPYLANDKNWEFNFLVYPWHRSGSLNNDCTRPEGKGVRTSVLKRKVISNLRFSPDTAWLDNIWTAEKTEGSAKNGITPVSIFNSNEVSLIKIPVPKNSGIKALNYYGNIDTLVTTNIDYSFYVCPSNVVKDPFTSSLQNISKDYASLSSGGSFVGDYNPQLKTTKEPVRMKYKSTPHAVFAFNYSDVETPVILPKLNDLNVFDTVLINPFWSSNQSVDPRFDNPIIAEIADSTISMSWEKTPSEIEKEIKETLLKKYPNAENGYYAICSCSSRLGNVSLADLYKLTITTKTDQNSAGGQTITTIKSWDKIKLEEKDVGTIYQYKGTNLFWEVSKESFGYCLQAADNNSTKYTVSQDSINYDGSAKAFLYIAELKRKSTPINRFGGDTSEALRNNLWLPAGKAVSLQEEINFEYGDTYYQRYDCLKTYPFTSEDENSVVEIASFMCESRINLDGRYDRNRGQLSNLNMSPQNFNLINSVYSQKDNFYNYRILDDQYYRTIKYPTQVLWSLEKTNLEDIDTWTNITLANSLDLNGSAGSVTSLATFNDTLFAFQEKAINQILFNSRVQIPTADNIPVEISNNYKVDGTRVLSDIIGCQDKRAVVKSPYGLYFIDKFTNALYCFSGELKNISIQNGMQRYMILNKLNILKLYYDSKNKDLYITSSGSPSLCYSEQLGCFTSYFAYTYKDVMFSLGDRFFTLRNSNETTLKLWENFTGDYNNFYDEIYMPFFTYISNEDPLYTKIFDTIEYQADFYDAEGNPLPNKSFETIQVYNEYQDSGTHNFNQLRRIINNKDNSLRKKFRIWRGQIPRDGRERIRNPWAAITIGFKPSSSEESSNFYFTLHNISTKYTI